MNADRLLAHYERIADAPEVGRRLRRFILDLAVHGKLVKQNPNDEPASELVKRIGMEKARLVKSELIKRPKQLEAVERDDTEFCIPSSWCWTRLGEITSYIQRGKSPKYGPTDGPPVVSQKCVQWHGLDLDKARKITHQSLATYENIRFLREGDLLWNSTGTGTIGRVIRIISPPERLVCDSHVTVVRCLLVSSEYIRTWLRTGNVYGLIEERAAGSTNQVELTAQMALNQVVPLPPLAEQRRIVAKVDELMALCDRLETAHTVRETTRDRLSASSLSRLNAPDPDPAIFRNHAAFALENFAPLTTRTDQIKALRQTILSLAVRGKLVEQDPNDEPTSELLRRMDVARLEMLEAGYPNPSEAQTQLKKLSTQTVPDYVENLPTGWSWATLQQCAMLVVDCKNKTAPYSPTGIRLVRTTNVKDGKLNASDQKYVNQETYEVWSARCKPETGDILITREAPMGEVCLIPPGETICLGQRIMLVRLVAGFIDRNFMLYSLRDPGLMDRVQDKPLGMTVQHLRVGGIETLLVAVPPLDEQHSIVAKVDELMVLCDRLEATLATDDDTRRRLLDALLHEVLPARRSRGYLTKRKTRAPKAIQRAACG